jgi:hypothetical protein
MAIFRKIYTKFWSDPYIQSLIPDNKFFFIYLLTNEKTKECGIYEITTRQMSFDTGYNIETVLTMIDFFSRDEKIMFSRETNEIAIKNWKKYNDTGSKDFQKFVNKEVGLIKNKDLVLWMDSPPTLPPPSGDILDKNRIDKNRIDYGLTTMVFDVEKLLKENPIQFERICISAKKNQEQAKESLRKYHLYLSEKEQYPKSKNALFSGFEKWLLNEKNFVQQKSLIENRPSSPPLKRLE